MIIDYPFLILGILLLWVPRHWMRRGVALLRRRRRSAESVRIVEPWREREPGDPRVSFRAEFTKFRNYVDLLRGGAGSVVLCGSKDITAAIVAAPQAPRSVNLQILGITGAIMLVGLLIQTVRYEKQRITFYPPIFYLAGISVGLCDARGALFAFLLIWAINPALPNAQAFLSIYALLLFVFGHVFAWRGDIRAAIAAVLCFLPVLLSLMSRRPLLAFSRRSSR